MNSQTKFINTLFHLVVILENSGDYIFTSVGLTVRTYSVLYLISIGLDTSTSLLNDMYGTKPNMTKKLSTLEEKGFIKRTMDKKDKRIWRFALTKEGIGALETIEPIYAKSVA